MSLNPARSAVEKLACLQATACECFAPKCGATTWTATDSERGGTSAVEHHGEDAKPKRRTLGASNPTDDRRCSQRGDTNCFGSYEKLL